MKFLFVLFTLFFCLSCVGLKTQFKNSTAQTWESSDSSDKFELPIIPIIHHFIILPAASSDFIQVAYSFISISNFKNINPDISSTGPPLV